MTRVRIVGRHRHLDGVLERLYELRQVELADAGDGSEPGLARLPGDADRGALMDELRFLAARLQSLTDLLGPGAAYGGDPVPGAVDAPRLRAEMQALEPEVEELTGRLQALETELAVLPRYVEPLRHLLPLVPELAELADAELASLGLDTAAIVLRTDDATIVDVLRAELARILGARFELVAAQVEPEHVGCVLVFPHSEREEVRGLLGAENVRHVPLPRAYERLSFAGAVRAMERRLAGVPGEIAAARAALDELIRPHEDAWRRTHAGLVAELEQLEAASLAAATERAFVLNGWVPSDAFPALREDIEGAVREIAVEELPTGRRDPRTPVLMRNAAPTRPFAAMVRFLGLPQPGSLDPSGLMMLFLPLMFGMMVGDVGYGAILLVLALAGEFRLRDGSQAARDLCRVLAVGSVWAIVFGLLFGEALGNLGKELGMPALWVYRPSEEALEPLLLFAVAVGGVHVTLGLALGLWESWRARAPRQALDRIGTLMVLAGVFALAGVAGDQLPGGALTPALAACLVGLVLVMSLHGPLGLLLGPLEVLGALGNVLSYLRLAAVGLASAYLAIVANELAVAAPIWIGVIVATFLHALNLALAAFSPSIQALRLHYVEFFSKFYLTGGRPFRPFGAPADPASPAGL